MCERFAFFSALRFFCFNFCSSVVVLLVCSSLLTFPSWPDIYRYLVRCPTLRAISGWFSTLFFARGVIILKNCPFFGADKLKSRCLVFKVSMPCVPSVITWSDRMFPSFSIFVGVLRILFALHQSGVFVTNCLV